MKEERYRFLELMGNVDDELIYQSCQPWQENNHFCAGAKMAVCAVLVLALCLAGVFHQQVEAAIRGFTTRIAKMLGISSDLASYTEVIGVSQTKEGITVTLEEVILAENQLYAAFHMEWEENPEMGGYMQAPDLNLIDEPKINGIEIMPVSSTIGVHDNGGNSDTSQDILAAYVYDDDSFPQEIYEIEMTANVLKEGDLESEGIPFTFHFSASKEELQRDTYSKLIDREIKASGGVTFKITKFQFNKVFSRLNVTPNEEFRREPNIMGYILIGTDSEGNKLRYEMSGGTDDNLIFESVGTPPSVNSRWVELQLYEAAIPAEEEVELSPDGESEEAWGVYDVDKLDYAVAGDKLRIDL